MGYDLDAMLARHADISAWKLTSALVFPLTADLGLIPNTGGFFKEINPLEDWAKEKSKGTQVAHLTAGYFGGVGDQDCTIWTDGESTSGLKINDVLERFGVIANDKMDAFDTVGLGRYRSNERWAAHAVVDAIQDSIEALIGALQYTYEDKNVQEKVRSIAAERLGDLKAIDALDPLKQALQDPEYGTRLSASSALGKIGEPALPILIEALTQDDPWGIVFALGKIGPGAKSAAPSLIKLIKHEDWRIRLEVIQTLEAIGAVSWEIKSLLTDRDKLVRDAALKALTINKFLGPPQSKP